MYYVYKITNNINGNFYIGKRKNADPEKDTYMGSGKLIQAAIRKHGKENFSKEILNIFETNDDAADYEKLLVTKELVSLSECYNMHEGGHGGFCHINNVSIEERKNIKAIRKLQKEGKLNTSGTSNWTEETRLKILAGASKGAKRLNEKIAAGEIVIDYEKVSNAMKTDANFMKGKVWCVLEDAKDKTEKIVCKPNNIPNGYITCKEWNEINYKRNVKKDHSSYGRSWYNDGAKNYFLKRDNPLIEKLSLEKRRI